MFRETKSDKEAKSDRVTESNTEIRNTNTGMMNVDNRNENKTISHTESSLELNCNRPSMSGNG